MQLFISTFGNAKRHMKNPLPATIATEMTTVEIVVSGVVQGVGFRPFIYRIAHRFGIFGTVLNDGRGVVIVAQASPLQLEDFIRALRQEHPPLAKIASLDIRSFTLSHVFERFDIIASKRAEAATTWAPADSFVCDDCLGDMRDPANRRYLYPFINCTNCGPRYSIIEKLPYDRDHTTMRGFIMCPACRAEYEDPGDRRFHAQPIACPTCGPRLRLVDARGADVATDDIPAFVRHALRKGRIVAIKSIGGFHLAVSPFDEEAVRELRSRKKRDAKPFALMASTVEQVRRYAIVSGDEADILSSPARPIVLLSRLENSAISSAVAPKTPLLGFMLPSAPLHYLLLDDDALPALVMTSGNLSGRPICRTNEEALAQLPLIADYILLHDRDIHTRVDDTVLRLSRRQEGGRPYLTYLRRSRGVAPHPIHLPEPTSRPIVAFGAELKTTVAVSRGAEVFLSQHIGDIANAETFAAHQAIADQLAELNGIRSEIIACDLHPDFRATREALSQSALPVEMVQHHHAHMASCMAENGLVGATIGVIFDGTGYGTDGTIWGGEFLVGDYESVARAAHLKPSLLLGGDKAVREPVRTAVALLLETFCTLDDLPPSLPPLNALDLRQKHILEAMYRRRINAMPHTSMGRLFDGVASLLGLCHVAEYEGHGPIDLEALLDRDHAMATRFDYAIQTNGEGRLEIDFRPIVRGLVKALSERRPVDEISRRFHSTIIEIVVDICGRLSNRYGTKQVVLSGGVFLNEFLLVNSIARLGALGYAVHHQTAVPPNDGGISLGQIAVANARIACCNAVLSQ
jgi:hydrogenase maturation protein HypF